MTSILSSMFERLKRSKSLWIILAIAFFLPVVTDSLLYFLYKVVATEVGGNVELVFTLMNLSGKSLALGEISPDSTGGLLAAIFIAVFVCCEFTEGNVKTIQLAAKTRTQTFFAYAAFSAILSAIIVLTSFLSNLLFGTLFFGYSTSNVVSAEVGEMICCIGLTVAVAVAHGVIFFLWTSLFKKKVGVIVMAIFFYGVVSSILSGLAQLIYVGGNMSAEAFRSLCEWIPLLQLDILAGGASISEAGIDAVEGGFSVMLALKIIIVQIVVVGLFGLFGWLSMRKADFK